MFRPSNGTLHFQLQILSDHIHSFLIQKSKQAQIYPRNYHFQLVIAHKIQKFPFINQIKFQERDRGPKMKQWVKIYDLRKKYRFKSPYYDYLLAQLLIQNSEMASINTDKYQSSLKTTKIPLLLKIRLIKEIEEEGLNIKQAAIKAHINYSSAKLIYKRFKLYKIKQIKEKRKLKFGSNYAELEYQVADQSKRCRYIAIKPDTTISNHDQPIKQVKRNNVVVISTISWDFMKDGFPTLDSIKK